MIHQYVGFMLVKTIFAIISKYSSYCQNFDMVEYKSNLYYFYSFNKNFQIIYLLAGIFVPIMIQAVINRTKKQIVAVMRAKT